MLLGSDIDLAIRLVSFFGISMLLYRKVLKLTGLFGRFFSSGKITFGPKIWTVWPNAIEFWIYQAKKILIDGERDNAIENHLSKT